MRRRYTKKANWPSKNIKEQTSNESLNSQLDANIQKLKQLLDGPNDLVIREFLLNNNPTMKGSVVYMDGLIDKQLVQESILRNMKDFASNKKSYDTSKTILEVMYENFISIHSVEKGNTLEDALDGILVGKTVILIDGQTSALIINTKGGESRSIDEPTTEMVVRGPRVGFVESLGTNLALLRKSLQTSSLRFQTHQIGRRSKKSLVVAYVDGVVHPEIVKEVNRRIQSIDIDDAPESGFIEQWIEDSFLSPFPQMDNTERSDKASSELLQGKVVILLDGTPFVLIAPFTLGDFLKSPEDYNERWLIGTLLRILRYVAAFFALLLPSLYIALISLHPGLLPTDMALSIAATREEVPFPPVAEAFLMVLTMELLQEAGLRLPAPIGQTIGIVGGLVIGDAAVSAGIVSPIMVIVIGLTAISAFATPSFSLGISFRILRIAFMLAAGILGLFGIILVYIMVMIHMVNLKSFGVPYTAPFSPTMDRDWKDLILRAPMTILTRRPNFMNTKDVDSGSREKE
ncbi:spore germination protein [Gracilibacillus halotolerans]|uniref:Spore germination protein n=1 Tax=Gracilibacillus halotolerans TaxID=74386 RepID=A0A841RQR9_9BACI|nr:spore germination protein [Gracilibacillus halotolerans]MBB6513274.1 spore germination protein [Gracilibacillus halotolerans]